MKTTKRLIAALALAIALYGSPASAQSVIPKHTAATPLTVMGYTLGQTEHVFKVGFLYEGGKLVKFENVGTVAGAKEDHAHGKATPIITLADAIGKFGKPTTQRKTVMQNGFGARWENTFSTWILPNGVVQLFEDNG